MIVASSVKRVVTCFILSSTSPNPNRESLRIAVFQRKDSMPTFPSHWAGVSGSIEEGEEPWESAVRELKEETNLIVVNENNHNNNDIKDDNCKVLSCSIPQLGGLYLDVPFKPDRAIRVYPFIVHLDDSSAAELLELQGTEHDSYKFISVAELEALSPAVPGLATAFHHATFGHYRSRSELPKEIWQWSNDRVNGATTLAKQALDLATNLKPTAEQLGIMATLRPTMVPIVNVCQELKHKMEQGEDVQVAAKSISESLKQQVERSIQLGVEALESIRTKDSTEFTIATFSRSSTIVRLLQQFLEKNKNKNKNNSNNNNLRVLCAKSTPGDEGEFMAKDLKELGYPSVECVEDDALHQAIRENKVQVVLVGSDCLLKDQVVNKVGTKALAETCREASNCHVVCCGDQWKLWKDDFPPPLEDIFECVPRDCLDQVLVPEG